MSRDIGTRHEAPSHEDPIPDSCTLRTVYGYVRCTASARLYVSGAWCGAIEHFNSAIPDTRYSSTNSSTHMECEHKPNGSQSSLCCATDACSSRALQLSPHLHSTAVMGAVPNTQHRHRGAVALRRK